MREETAKAIVCPQFRTTHATLLGGRHSRQIENLRGILDLNRFLRVLRSRTTKLFRHGRSVSGLACTVCLERHCTGIVLALYGARPTAPHSRRDSYPAGFWGCMNKAALCAQSTRTKLPLQTSPCSGLYGGMLCLCDSMVRLVRTRTMFFFDSFFS